LHHQEEILFSDIEIWIIGKEPQGSRKQQPSKPKSTEDQANQVDLGEISQALTCQEY